MEVRHLCSLSTISLVCATLRYLTTQMCMWHDMTTAGPADREDAVAGDASGVVQPPLQLHSSTAHRPRKYQG
eukprot:6191955-Pleurochrysis_carterae.AAC.2